MVDCTDPSMKEATHKNTRWHGYICRYPCHLAHCDIIDEYVRKNEATLRKTNGSLFQKENSYEKHDGSSWSIFVKDIYRQFLPEHIDCPNPKDFRKVFITYLRKNVLEDGSGRNKQILDGACYIQKHSLSTQRLTYSQKEKDNAMVAVLEFSFGVSNFQNQMQTPVSIQRRQPIENEESDDGDNYDNDNDDNDANHEIEVECSDDDNHEIEAECSDGDSDDEEQETYIAEKIVSKRTRKRKIEYLVKWKGYNSSENTWEPEENILCPTLIEEFKKA